MTTGRKQRDDQTQTGLAALRAGLWGGALGVILGSPGMAQTIDPVIQGTVASDPLAWATTNGGVDGPALAPTDSGDLPLADGTLQSSVTSPAGRRTPRETPPAAATSQQGGAATLLADRVDVTGNNVLTATGGVVVWYQGARLVASRVVFDDASGRLSIEGPIHLTRPGDVGTRNEAILLADQADLDANMTDGIIRGARMVLARELQFAATEITRRDQGRFTTMKNVVASSCQICASDPTPLWEIRARQITLDNETQQLRFDRPQFRAFGMPLATLPWLTAPAPGVARMTGFLRPEIRTTSELGFGIKTPYFITLGDHADLTLTPYLAVSRTATLEARYRQAFSNGAVEWNGAVSRDDIKTDTTRGYLFGAARFDLPRDYRLGVQVQMASSRGYLLDYGITDADRLWSGVTLERYRLSEMTRLRVGNYQPLRNEVGSITSPGLVADAIWQRSFSPQWIGGTAWLEWSAHAHRRRSGEDIVGRDMARASASLDWQRREILAGGIVATGQARFDADIYRIMDDSRYDATVGRFAPTVGVELRWPWMSRAGGATNIIEPVAQLVWSRPADNSVPNEDSVLLEFDEGNLFSLNRGAGWDAREGGLRANVGLGWTRIDPAGWSFNVTGGRVFRARDDGGLSGALGGRRSDWMLAANYSGANGLAVANRALFDDDFDIHRNEFRLGWLRPGLQASAGYLWIDAASEPGRSEDVSELSAAAAWQAAPGWWASTETRYDFTADRAQKAKLGVSYRNECVTVDVNVSRRFTASGNVRPDTTFGLSVQLAGFGQRADGRGTVARRSCVR